jgi:hypothetical protein
MLPRKRLFAIQAVLVLTVLTLAAHAQTKPDFSGTWKQDNAHSIPVRSGDVTLKVEHHDPDFTVETTMSRPLLPKRHAVQKYTTDGTQTRITWDDQALVFKIVEHEDGRIIETTETWSLVDNGSVLKRIRKSFKSKDEQTILYTRAD